MWNLIFFFKKQMNLYTKQKETNRCRKQTYGYQRGKVEGRDKLEVWSSIVVYTYYYIENRQPTRTYCIAQRTLLNIL